MDLVTGGAGFIGSHLVEELVRRGRRLRVLDNLTTGRPEALQAVRDDIELVVADILDPAAVRAAMRGVERVFHQAALRSVPRSVADPAATTRVNIEGTLNVLMAARDAGVRRVVFASSSSVYGDGTTLPTAEGERPWPLSPYAVSKVAAEDYCRVFTTLYGLPTVSLRYFNVFGPRQDPESEYAAVIPRFIRAGLRGESLEVHGDGLQSRDFTPVENVVLANCLAAERDGIAGEVFNVACGRRTALVDIISALGRILGGNGRPLRWHYAPARAGDVRHTQADIAKSETRLGYRPCLDFEEGLRQTVEWLRGTLDAPLAA